jgi:hypothetical protein
MVSFAPRPLYHQGKSPWYQLVRRLGGPRSLSGRGGERKIPSCHRELNPRTWPRAIPNELSRLSFISKAKQIEELFHDALFVFCWVVTKHKNKSSCLITLISATQQLVVPLVIHNNTSFFSEPQEEIQDMFRVIEFPVYFPS